MKVPMGELGAFLKIDRADPLERDPGERVGDYREFVRPLPVAELQRQGARCMECGVPFCHHGCPLGNLIPDWNDLVYRDRWHDAITELHRTNNFPEFTGRLCPAPCEAACVLEIREGEAVTIKQMEVSIIDRAWEEGWVVPHPPAARSGRTVAVIGSGPAGLACAQQLNRLGHAVTVLERDEAGGGLVRFGVPDFKIEKRVVERRLEQLVAEGIEFRFGVEVGVDIDAKEVRDRYDAVVVATGSRVPRDLPVPGRELGGVHFAMDYLYQRTRWVARELGAVPAGAPPEPAPEQTISAAGKHVIVIGGGDTGADCVGQAHREHAASVTQIELLGEPPPHTARRGHPLAPLADEAPHLLRPQGGRGARLRHLHHPLRGDRRPGGADPLGAEQRRAAVRARAGHRGVPAGGARPARHGLPPRGARPARRGSASSGMPAATPWRPPTPPRSTASSPQAMRAVGSR